MPRRKSTHVDNPVEVGRRLKEARERAGLSQRQLSYREGKPREAIARLEEARAIGHIDLADYPSWADTLGRAYASVDQLDVAIVLFESSLRSAEERKDAVEAIRFAVLLANALID